jgi:hypothetical protein
MPIANTTKYPTFASSGSADLSERMIAVVPDVTASSLADLSTLNARKRPIWCTPCSSPVLASTNAIQKPATATASSRFQLWRRYGRFRRVTSSPRTMLSLNGSSIGACGSFAVLVPPAPGAPPAPARAA